MKLTYIHHSGFLVEMEKVLLLFDFVDGELPELSPEKELMIFVSHRHADHFSSKIFELAKVHPRIRFVMSDDIWQNRVPEEMGCHTEFIDPGEVLELPEGDGVCITAFKSTDEGVAFMVQTEGKTIYHAGDLNNWRWNGETKAWNNNMAANYTRELVKMRDQEFKPDVAMVPLDGRLEDCFYLGLDEFMKTVGAGFVLPMHCWDDFGVIGQLKAMDCSADYREKVADIEKAGQSWVL